MERFHSPWKVSRDSRNARVQPFYGRIRAVARALSSLATERSTVEPSVVAAVAVRSHRIAIVGPKEVVAGDARLAADGTEGRGFEVRVGRHGQWGARTIRVRALHGDVLAFS